MTDIDKDDVSRGLGGFGEIGLGDTVTESDGGCVVDQSKGVKTSNLSGIVKSSSLNVSVPTWNGDNDIRDGLLELCLGGISQFAEVGSGDLGEGKGRWLAKVLNLRCQLATLHFSLFLTYLDSDLSVDINELGVDELLLKLCDLWV